MSSLEERVAAIEERLNMEAELRASGDQDLSDVQSKLRALNHLVQAISITQSDHTTVLERHTEALVRVEAGMNQILVLLNRLTGDQ